MRSDRRRRAAIASVIGRSTSPSRRRMPPGTAASPMRCAVRRSTDERRRARLDLRASAIDGRPRSARRAASSASTAAPTRSSTRRTSRCSPSSIAARRAPASPSPSERATVAPAGRHGPRLARLHRRGARRPCAGTSRSATAATRRPARARVRNIQPVVRRPTAHCGGELRRPRRHRARSRSPTTATSSTRSSCVEAFASPEERAAPEPRTPRSSRSSIAKAARRRPSLDRLRQVHAALARLVLARHRRPPTQLIGVRDGHGQPTALHRAARRGLDAGVRDLRPRQRRRDVRPRRRARRDRRHRRRRA